MLRILSEAGMAARRQGRSGRNRRDSSNWDGCAPTV